MLQERISDVSGGSANVVVASQKPLTFDAVSAVRAIVFHLMDEKLATGVSVEVIRRTVERLTANCFAATHINGRHIR